MKKFKVTGRSGMVDNIEASTGMEASQQFIEHHNDLVQEVIEVKELKGTGSAYITEEDTYSE